MRYYDLIETPKTGKTFSEGGLNRLPKTDSKVAVYFQSIDKVKYDRGFDIDGYPILKEYSLQEDGTRFSLYLDVPDSEGVYQPDIVAIEAEARIQAKNQVNIDYEAQVNALTEGVPEAEIKTWTKQELEARAYKADNTTSTPLIDALCEARGVPKDYLIGKIIDKAEIYAVAVGTLTGIRQKAEDEFTA